MIENITIAQLLAAYQNGLDTIADSGFDQESVWNWGNDRAQDNFVNAFATADSLREYFEDNSIAEMYVSDVLNNTHDYDLNHSLTQLALQAIVLDDHDAGDWLESGFCGHDYYEILDFLIGQAELLDSHKLIDRYDFDGQDFLRACFVDGAAWFDTPCQSDILAAMDGDRKAARRVRRSIYEAYTD